MVLLTIQSVQRGTNNHGSVAFQMDASLLSLNDVVILQYKSDVFCRKLKEDKEELEEQRRLRQQEEERSLVTVSCLKSLMWRVRRF